MSFINVNSFLRNYESERHEILRDLRNITRECRDKYGNKTELATEDDPRIIRLSDCWELLLFHGLQTSVFKANASFWELAESHLTFHERGRFSTLRHVHTDRGKFRALIRAALNERSLERYVLMWLSDETLKDRYEPHACILSNETAQALPELAKSLTNILFALTVDSPELNVDRKLNLTEREEPIIPVSEPVTKTGGHRKPRPVERDILEREEKVVLPIPEPVSRPSSLLVPRGSTPSRSSTAASSFNGSFHDTDEVFPSFENLDPSPEYSLVNGYHAPETNPKPPEEVSSSKDSSVASFHEAPEPLEDLEALRAKLKEREKRITQLEDQVAALSLENCRLRMLSSSARHTKMFFSVAIPRAFLERQVPSGKRYFVYEIHITPANDVGETWVVRRRYSEFYALHKRLVAQDPSIKALDFPPKKNFGNMDGVFVEQRRQRLHVYIKHLITVLPEVSECCSKSELCSTFPFLDPEAKL